MLPWTPSISFANIAVWLLKIHKRLFLYLLDLVELSKDTVCYLCRNSRLTLEVEAEATVKTTEKFLKFSGMKQWEKDQANLFFFFFFSRRLNWASEKYEAHEVKSCGLLNGSPWLDEKWVSDQTMLLKWDCCCSPTKHRSAQKCKFLTELRTRETAELFVGQWGMKIKTNTDLRGEKTSWFYS